MANPYQYLTPTGVIVPDTSNILSDVQTDYRQAFGSDLIVTPDTPQGTLITAETAARVEVVQNNAALANQINPNIAGGVFLDAIAALTGIQRVAATMTVVPGVTLSGVAGTVIPAGSIAQTVVGDQFQTLASVVIGGGGTVTVDFAAVNFGPISCAVNALSQIVTSVIGWENVNNTNAGVLGANTQSDQSLRAYRNNTLGFQGVALPSAIVSALYATAGVQSLWFQENVAATTQTINGISMVGHSIYACVNGGSNLAVASALLENKSSGCAWVGGTSVNVIEAASGQTYNVLFDRPTAVPLIIKVTTKDGNPPDIVNAVLAWSNGQVANVKGLIVGGPVSPFEISAAVVEQTNSYVTKVEIGTVAGGTYSTNEMAIAVNQIATIAAANITVVIG